MDECAADGCPNLMTATFQPEVGHPDSVISVLIEFPLCAGHLATASTGVTFRLKPKAMKVVSVGTRRGYDAAVFDVTPV
jgi:hypothetical protein